MVKQNVMICPKCGSNDFGLRLIKDSSFFKTGTCLVCGWQEET